MNKERNSLGAKLTALLLALLFTACASAASHYERGDAAYLAGDFDAASKFYRNAKRKDPLLAGIDEKIHITEIRLFMQRGDRAVARADWAAAENAYGEVRYRDPKNEALPGRLRDMTLARAEHHYQSGYHLLESGDPFGAIPELERALSFNAQHPRAGQTLDQARVQKNDREERAKRRFMEGRTALTLGRREEAMELFATALELNPHHTEARQQLSEIKTAIAKEFVANGDLHMLQHEWRLALDRFHQAAEYDPGFYGLSDRIQRAENEAQAEVLLVDAHRSFEIGDWSTAFALFDEAWHLASDREAFHTRYDTARREFADDLYSDSLAAEIQGRLDAALRCLDTIDQLYPNYRDCTAFRARLVQRKHDTSRFYASGKRAQRIRDLVTARDFYTACENMIANYSDVASRLEEIGAELEQAERMYLRGLAAEQQTDFGRARILYEECLHIAKPYRDALQRLAKLGTESGADGADGER